MSWWQLLRNRSFILGSMGFAIATLFVVLISLLDLSSYVIIQWKDWRAPVLHLFWEVIAGVFAGYFMGFALQTSQKVRTVVAGGIAFGLGFGVLGPVLGAVTLWLNYIFPLPLESFPFVCNAANAGLQGLVIGLVFGIVMYPKQAFRFMLYGGFGFGLGGLFGGGIAVFDICSELGRAGGIIRISVDALILGLFGGAAITGVAMMNQTEEKREH